MFLCFLSLVDLAPGDLKEGKKRRENGVSYPTPDSDLYVCAESEKTSPARQADSMVGWDLRIWRRHACQQSETRAPAR